MKDLIYGLYSFYSRRIRANSPGFLREYWPYLVAVLIAATLDFITTCRFMSEGSVSDEFHPIIRFVSVICGPIWGPLFGKLCQIIATLFLAITFKPIARIVLVLVAVIYLYAAWFNTWGVNLYTPLFVRLFYPLNP